MWYSIVSLLVLMYGLTYMIVPALSNGSISSYTIHPIMWSIIAIVTIIQAKKHNISIWSAKKIRKWTFGSSPFQAAILLGSFHISILIIMGLFFGFGNSPYSFHPISILTNSIFIGSLLIGGELARSYLIKKGKKIRNHTMLLGGITLLFVLIRLSPPFFSSQNFSTPLVTIETIGSILLPLFSIQLLASYLSYLGGAKTSIGYMSILLVFQWFVPIQPNLTWMLEAFIATLIPALGFIIIQNSLQSETSSWNIRSKEKQDPLLHWVFVGVIGLCMVFLSTGFFGIQPTVIYSGSMQPSYHVGDIVLVGDVDPSSLKTGDIIQFQKNNITIIHRIHEIHKEPDTLLFITKGDANEYPDSDPIEPYQIMGKIQLSIPAIGWINILINKGINEIKKTISPKGEIVNAQ